jgi:hypothetical protein
MFHEEFVSNWSLRERFHRQHLSKHRGRIILHVVTSLSIVSWLPALGKGGHSFRDASDGNDDGIRPESVTKKQCVK